MGRVNFCLFFFSVQCLFNIEYKVTLNLLKETSTAIKKKLSLSYLEYYFILKFVEINLMKALSVRKIRNKYQLF